MAVREKGAARRTALRAQRSYWDHVRSHGCHKRAGQPGGAPTETLPEVDVLWRHFQNAKNQLDLAHDSLNDARDVHASSEIPSPDGQYAYERALQIQELAASEYLRTLGDLKAAAVPPDDLNEDGNGKPVGHTHPAPIGIELLTPREIEVLKFIASGKSGREVAEHLGISFKTVFVHRQRIYAKLQVHKITDLIRVAMRMGWIDA